MSSSPALPPGATGVPVFGETLAFIRSPSAFLRTRVRRHGPLFRTHLFGRPTVFWATPEGARWLFSAEGRQVVNEWPSTVRALLGPRCVAMLEGAEHRARRRQLDPMFSSTAAPAWAPRIAEITDRHLDGWHAPGGSARSEVVMIPAFRALAFEIAAEILLGPRPPAWLDALSADFAVWTEGMFVPLALALPRTRFARALAAKRRLVGELGAVVRQARYRPPAPETILARLLGPTEHEPGDSLDDETIVDELLLLLFAGHDTTVTALANLVWALLERPLLTARLVAEQAAAVDADLSGDLAARWPLLHQTLRESMRCVPPIGGAFRRVIAPAELGAFTIPPGWIVALSPAASHGDTEAWTEPERFDPDRFCPARAEPRGGAGAYIPFGGGPRLCLGRHFAMTEMLIVMARLLTRYELELAPRQDLRRVEIPFPRARSGLVVRIRPRERPDAPAAEPRA